MKIVVTDPIISRFATILRSGGHDPLLAAGRPDEEILAALGDADVMVCSRMTEQMAHAGTGLRLVQVTGAGYERIPLGALSPGTAVANTSHHGRAIAEHVIMTVLMLSRRVLRTDRLLRQGVWESVAVDPDLPLGEAVAGRTVGLIGLGEIGRQVARLAVAMGMRAQAVRRDPGAPLEAGLDLDRVMSMGELPTLLATSDVVVVTVPLSPHTRGLIGAGELRRMRRSAFLVNVSRGPVVDERALYDALAGGLIAGAAIDVWWPTDGVSRGGTTLPFAELDNVVLTPHNSGHTRGTFESRARDIAANLTALEDGRPLRNVVRGGA